MKNISDFLLTALPWISIGLLLAVFFAQNARKKTENCGSEGIALGMCFGVVIGTSLGSTSIGLALGMSAGYIIGSLIEKKEEKNHDFENCKTDGK